MSFPQKKIGYMIQDEKGDFFFYGDFYHTDQGEIFFNKTDALTNLRELREWDKERDFKLLKIVAFIFEEEA